MGVFEYSPEKNIKKRKNQEICVLEKSQNFSSPKKLGIFFDPLEEFIDLCFLPIYVPSMLLCAWIFSVPCILIRETDPIKIAW